jgi:transposase-like protein
MGRYSNHRDQAELIRGLIESAPKDAVEPKVRTIRKTARRLDVNEVGALVEGYLAGATVYDLARRFEVHRSTVSIVLERNGVSRRSRLLNGERVLQAASLYAAGSTLALVGRELGVSRSTVALALKRAGVQIRRGGRAGHTEAVSPQTAPLPGHNTQ